LPGFIQPIEIVTALFFLARVGLQAVELFLLLLVVLFNTPMVPWSSFRTEQDSFLKRSGTNKEPFVED
jgi:hypothetical protein